MRKARAALALLIAFAVPVRAETTADPLWHLLSSYVLTPDEKAVSSEGEGAADAKGLASLQADLLLLSDGFESFRDEDQVKESLARLEPRMSPELKPFFRDRAASLDAIYRTLSVADFTWAGRFPQPPCNPSESREALLSSRDGLFQTESGEASPWLVALLGPRAQGRSAAAALDQASAKARLSPNAYEKRRAAARRLSLALASERAEGVARAKLYCARAAVYEDLAAHHRARDAGPIEASSSAAAKPEESVFVVVWKNQRGAATLLRTKAGPVLVTDAAIVSDVDHPYLFAYAGDAKPIPLTATVVRRHTELGVAVLSYSEDQPRPSLALAGKAPAKDDLVTAIGHTQVSGLWTRTSGLVAKTGDVSFQTDAAVSPELTGGPVLNEAGEVVGLLILRPADTEEGRWPVAIPAPVLARWLDDSEAPAAPGTEAIEDAGTAAILSRARPDPIEAGLGAWVIPPMGPPPPTPHGVCVSNCGGGYTRSRPRSSGGSSYSSGSGGEEIGKALGEALAPLVEALVFQGIPALFRGIGKLFKGKEGSVSSSVSKSPPKPRPADPPKKAPPPPPKPKCSLVKDESPSRAGAQPFEVSFSVNCKDSEVPLAGHSVRFEFTWDGQKSTQTVTLPTDASGRAMLHLQVVNEETKRQKVRDESEKQHDELDHYDPEKAAPQIPESEEAPSVGMNQEGLIAASETLVLEKAVAPAAAPLVAAAGRRALVLVGRGAVLGVTGTLVATVGGAVIVAEMSRQTFLIGWDIGTAIEKEISSVQRGLREEEKNDCEFARKFHLMRCRPPIAREHAFKDEWAARPNKFYDICACQDGSIIIKAHGTCGKPGPAIRTDRRWK